MSVIFFPTLFLSWNVLVCVCIMYPMAKRCPCCYLLRCGCCFHYLKSTSTHSVHGQIQSFLNDNRVLLPSILLRVNLLGYWSKHWIPVWRKKYSYEPMVQMRCWRMYVNKSAGNQLEISFVVWLTSLYWYARREVQTYFSYSFSSHLFQRGIFMIVYES